jgi:sensor histidine kinase YesM
LRLPSNTYRHLFHFSIALIIIFPWGYIIRPGEGPGGPRMHGFLMYWQWFALLSVPLYLLNSYWAVPKLLKNQRYGMYLLIIALCLLVSFLFRTGFERFTPAVASVHLPESVTVRPVHIIPLLFIFTLGTSLEMILGWEKQRTLQREIEKEKLESELAMLKTQINPHFFFNALNSIYALSDKKSEKTGDAILLLSSIMRYVLYDANRSKIELAKEVQHLEDYIAMQRLRISDREQVQIEFQFQGDGTAQFIEPLILIPFVENAFKHGVSYDQPSFIKIDLRVSGGVFYFEVTNSKKKHADAAHATHDDYHGIGITNTRKRLDLMYKDRYILTIKDRHDQYSTHLTIHLDDADYALNRKTA